MELIEQIAAVIRVPVLPQELGVGQEPVGSIGVICDYGGLILSFVFIPISIHIDISGDGCSAVAAQRNVHGLQGAGGRAEHELAVTGIGTRLMGLHYNSAVVIDIGLVSIYAAVNEAEALHLPAEGRKRRRIRDGGDKRGQDLCGIIGFVPRRDREAPRGHIVVEFQEMLHRLSVRTKDGEELSNVVLILVQNLHQHVIDILVANLHRRKNELVSRSQLAIDLAVAVVVDVVLNTADGQGHVALHGDIVGGVIGKGKILHAEHAQADGDLGIACVRFTVKEDLIRVRQVEIDVLQVLDSPVGGQRGRRITKVVRPQILICGLERNRVISVRVCFGGLAHLIGKFNVCVFKECLHGLLDLLTVQITGLGPGNGRGHIHIELLHAVEDHVDRVVVTGTQITAAGKRITIGTHKLQSGFFIPHYTGVDFDAVAVGEVYGGNFVFFDGDVLIAGISGILQRQRGADVHISRLIHAASAGRHGDRGRNSLVQTRAIRRGDGIVIRRVDQVFDVSRQHPARCLGLQIDGAAGVSGVSPANILGTQGNEQARRPLDDRNCFAHIRVVSGRSAFDERNGVVYLVQRLSRRA